VKQTKHVSVGGTFAQNLSHPTFVIR